MLLLDVIHLTNSSFSDKIAFFFQFNCIPKTGIISVVLINKLWQIHRWIDNEEKLT